MSARVDGHFHHRSDEDVFPRTFSMAPQDLGLLRREPSLKLRCCKQPIASSLMACLEGFCFLELKVVWTEPTMKLFFLFLCHQISMVKQIDSQEKFSVFVTTCASQVLWRWFDDLPLSIRSSDNPECIRTLQLNWIELLISPNLVSNGSHCDRRKREND